MSERSAAADIHIQPAPKAGTGNGNVERLKRRAIVVGAEVPAPQTQPISAAEEARLKRGVEVRRVLLQALKEADSNGEIWPDQLENGGAARLIYTKPQKQGLTWDDTARAQGVVA